MPNADPGIGKPGITRRSSNGNGDPLYVTAGRPRVDRSTIRTAAGSSHSTAVVQPAASRPTIAPNAFPYRSRLIDIWRSHCERGSRDGDAMSAG